MAKTAIDVVAMAQSWLGRREGNGTHKAIIDVYNAHKPLARGYAVKYTDSWCATFVSAVAIKTGCTDIIPLECSCEQMIELFKKIGSWEENDARTPKPGDVIFYDWQDNGIGDNKGWSDHVGIVEKVSGTTITIIEGNKNNAVERRIINVNAKGIRGYGVPKYATKSIPVASSTPTAKKDLDTVAKEVVAGKWGNGDDRKNRLESAGYNYSEVQAKVNELSSGSSKKKTVTEIAKEVIAGKWGVGAERKKKIIAVGYDYNAVQKKVNSLMK